MKFDNKWRFVQDMHDLDDHPTVYVGCMSGTSVDVAVDFCAAVFDKEGLPIVYRTTTKRLPPTLRQACLSLSQSVLDQFTTEYISDVEKSFSNFLATAFSEVLEEFSLSSYDKSRLVFSPHGQTIDHQPLATPPFCRVLGDGAQLAAQLDCAVVMQHRAAVIEKTLAAPLAPVLVRRLFYSAKKNTVVLNGGGIANIAVLLAGRPNEVVGFDTGPANGPLDAWVRHVVTKNNSASAWMKSLAADGFDRAGAWAAEGQVIDALKQSLLDHPYFSRPRQQKSADRADFDLRWILPAINKESNQDVMTTVCEVVALSIAEAIKNAIPQALRSSQNRLIVYGGLAHNAYVIARIQALLADSLQPEWVAMADLHYEPDCFEALLMAYLGWCVHQRQTVDLSYCARAGIEDAALIPGRLLGQ